jgi:hypothetical protein
MTAKSRSKAPPKWIHEDLVACLDGPLINQWFTAEDWAARVEAARYILEARGARRQPCLDYEMTSRRVRHPDQEMATGGVLAYVPNAARKAGERAA